MIINVRRRNKFKQNLEPYDHSQYISCTLEFIHSIRENILFHCFSLLFSTEFFTLYVAQSYIKA